MDDISYPEIDNLLQSIYEKYGYDFRDYSMAHLKRRIMNRVALSGVESPADLHKKALTDKVFISSLVRDLSIKVTEMFRDPAFYVSLREKVIPLLKTYSYIKIWHAGCATGEEVYSMAILLTEENLYDKCLIYATDISQDALDHGKAGIYNVEKAKDFSVNYQRARGKNSLSEYYTYKYDSIIMNNSLKKNIVWANHNLATDNVFAEVNLILCRNVMIYFNKTLQNRAHNLFLSSLTNGGFLSLGMKESLLYSEATEKYIEVDKKNKIYRKKYF